MKTKFLTPLLLLTLSFSGLAFAGNGDYGAGNGGDVVVSEDGKIKFLDLIERHDEFEHVYISPKSVEHWEPVGDMEFARVHIETTLKVLLDSDGQTCPAYKNSRNSDINGYWFTKINTSLGSYHRKTNMRLALKPLVWILMKETIESIDDEGVVKDLINFNGKVVQLAVQKDGIVVINESLFSKLTEYEKAAFFIHEAVIYTLINENPKYFETNSTEKVRKMVQGLFKIAAKEKYIPIEVYANLCNAL